GHRNVSIARLRELASESHTISSAMACKEPPFSVTLVAGGTVHVFSRANNLRTAQVPLKLECFIAAGSWPARVIAAQTQPRCVRCCPVLLISHHVAARRAIHWANINPFI